MVLRMKNSIIFGVHWKNPTFKGGGGGSRKTNIDGRVALKGELGQFADLRGGLGKKEWGMIPHCTPW